MKQPTKRTKKKVKIQPTFGPGDWSDGRKGGVAKKRVETRGEDGYLCTDWQLVTCVGERRGASSKKKRFQKLHLAGGIFRGHECAQETHASDVKTDQW